MTESTSPSHPFDDAVELRVFTPGVYLGRTSEAYDNMVGPFGGMTAATIIRAVIMHPDRLGDPLSLTVNFAGPVSEGEFELAARVVRTNRSNQHWYLELSQDGEIATTATAVFGTRRQTWDDPEAAPPDVPAPSDVAVGRFPDSIAWAQNYEMRFVAGELSEEKSADSETSVWVRDTPARPLDYEALTSMADVFYPRVFQRRGSFLPAGTVTLTVHYLATVDELVAQSDSYVLARAYARRFHRGYFDQTAELWGADETLLATSHQLVYYKG